MADWTRILGIDPGSRITGYGVIDTNGIKTRYVSSGCIRMADAPLPRRLRQIYAGVRAIVTEFKPEQVAVELVFMHRNADSALKLGQARAAAICATFEEDIECFEYAARAVKQSVVGRGGADKFQVQHMVKTLLCLNAVPMPDEADALAVALCHAHHQPLADRIASSLQQPGGAR